MKVPVTKYKNIDKSSQLLFNEKSTFKVIHFKNLDEETFNYKYTLKTNYIQLYFCISNKCKIAFNMEHCAIELLETNSSMVYFKDDQMDILFNISPKTEVIAVLISIEYFHSLFSSEGNFLFNFSNFKIGQPIIEPKEINTTSKLILNQLTSKNITESLQPIYIKGKIYELLSVYFSNITEENSDHCPFITNEEVVGKIKMAKEIVISNMNNPPSLSDLAKEVGLNIKKLKSDFKEFYGVPVFSFLLNYKMELAKNLLQENKLNVNEISTHLGYSSSSHFIAAFKRKFGITPKQFSKS